MATIINDHMSIVSTKKGLMRMIIDGHKVAIRIPKGFQIGGPTKLKKKFQSFRNEKTNKYFIELFFNKIGWVSVYKVGPHIGTYEPLPDQKHPHQFKTACVGKDNKKIHQSHLR